MNETEPQCTCGCAKGKPHAYHKADCPMSQHPESVKELLKLTLYYKENNSKAAEHWRKEAQRWEGKYAIVKRENNALRRKLYPPKQKP